MDRNSETLHHYLKLKFLKNIKDHKKSLAKQIIRRKHSINEKIRKNIEKQNKERRSQKKELRKQKEEKKYIAKKLFNKKKN